MRGPKPDLKDIEPGSERFNQLAPAIQQKVIAAREAAERKRNKKKLVAEEAADAEEFWNMQRGTLKKAELDELLAQQKLVKVQEIWMLEGWKLTPSDPGYVEFEEGYARLKAFVKEHGLIRDVPEAFDNEALKGISYYALWCPIDSACGEMIIPAFFTAPHFDDLCRENRQTEVYAKYGIKVALRWSQVAEFRRMADSHQAPVGEGLHYRPAPGMKPSGQFRAVHGCWLCKQEAGGRSPQAVGSNAEPFAKF